MILTNEVICGGQVEGKGMRKDIGKNHWDMSGNTEKVRAFGEKRMRLCRCEMRLRIEVSDHQRPCVSCEETWLPSCK